MQNQQDYWAEPYYDELPEDTYRVISRDVNYAMHTNGQIYLSFKFSCCDGQFLDCPINFNLWLGSRFGESQLKGIIRRVLEAKTPGIELTPFSHLEAGNNAGQITQFLKDNLVGSLCEVRVEKNTGKDDKVYTNYFVHAILENGRMPANEVDMPF